MCVVAKPLTSTRYGALQTILGVFPETQSALNKIGNEAGSMLQRVANKEKYLNNQFNNYVRCLPTHTIAAPPPPTPRWLHLTSLLCRACSAPQADEYRTAHLSLKGSQEEYQVCDFTFRGCSWCRVLMFCCGPVSMPDHNTTRHKTDAGASFCGGHAGRGEGADG